MSLAAVKNVITFSCCGCRSGHFNSSQVRLSQVDKGQTSKGPVSGTKPSFPEKRLPNMYESFEPNDIEKTTFTPSCDAPNSDPKLRCFGNDVEDRSISPKCCDCCTSRLEEIKIFRGGEVQYKLFPDTNLNVESPGASVHCSSSTEEHCTSVVKSLAPPCDREVSRDSPSKENFQVPESSCSALFESLPCSLYSRAYSPVQLFSDVEGEDLLSYCKGALAACEEKLNALVNAVDERCVSLVLHTRIPFVGDTLTEPVDDETVEDAWDKLQVKKQFVQSMEKLQDDQLPTKRRGNLPKESTALLKKWFQDHADHPYPSDEQKIAMSQATNIGIAQISHWFINYRKRVWKPSMSSEGNVECTEGCAELSYRRYKKIRAN